MFIRNPQELARIAVNRRKKLKMTQAEVGSLVGLKQKTISAFENKAQGTKLETIFLILSALQLNLHLEPKEQISGKWIEEW